jgi:DNA end-binding protein Ku
MPRPLWRGAISFGLVTVPVVLYTATERAAEIHFRLLHAKDESPIDYRRVCEVEDVDVPWSQIVRGYEYEKGRYVVLTDNELAHARAEATQTLAIRDFVPARSIPDIYFDQPYYTAPSGKGAARAYALLRDALGRAGRVGIGTIVLRQREHLAALEPVDEALVLTTLRFAYEIRSAETLDLPPAHRGDKREMNLALQLIDTLAGDWDPTRYHDTYRETLLKVIERKAKGEEITAPPATKPARVVSLARALEQSLKTPRRDLARAHGRRRAAHRGRRAARRAA